MHALGARINDVDPSWLVAGMAGGALGDDGGFDLSPVCGGDDRG